MKRERLDQILLRMGIVNEDQIKQALMRQKSQGGKLGAHLLYYKFLSEEQLVHALAEQFGVSGIQFSGQRIPDEVIKKLPKELVEEKLVFPFRLEQETSTLFVAMSDPENSPLLNHIRKVTGVRNIKIHVASETVLRKMILSHYCGNEVDLSFDQIIELPDLFEEEPPAKKETGPPIKFSKDTETRSVLMITGASFLKTFLVSIFEREGFRLKVLFDREEIAAALQEGSFDNILLSEEMEKDFKNWVKDGKLPAPQADISVFSNVSGTLLDNPLPYNKVFESLLRSLQQMADYRCSMIPWKPPYGLICNDIRDIAHSLGLNRVAIDGLKIASFLLIPATIKLRNFDLKSFTDFERSVEIAKSLHFPWDIDVCLIFFFKLISGKISLEQSDRKNREISLAAQILALVWYRYYIFREIEGSPEAVLRTIKSGLREQASRLSSQEVVETYVRLLEQAERKTTIDKNIFIISDVNEISNQFVSRLKRDGFRTVGIRDFSEAQRLYERHRPSVVLINYDINPDHARKFAQRIIQDSDILLYAFTKGNKPSLIMDLLDSGFNDVFVPPFNYEIFLARINKSLIALRQNGSMPTKQKGLTATFQEISFVDLIQALAGSQRTVHISLQRKTGEKADVYMRKGQMVRATCGEISGVEAVYKMISWRNNGSFRTESTNEFPPDNISLPNDFILLEGCRLLDEGDL